MVKKVFGLLLTLVGSVLLVVMVAVRQDNDMDELTSIITPVLGEVHPKVEGILKESYLFRIGLIYLIFGTLLQIFGFDISLNEIDILLKIGIVVVGFILLLYLGRKTAYYFVDKKLRTISPFNGYGGNAPVGAMWVERTQELQDEKTIDKDNLS